MSKNLLTAPLDLPPLTGLDGGATTFGYMSLSYCVRIHVISIQESSMTTAPLSDSEDHETAESPRGLLQNCMPRWIVATTTNITTSCIASTRVGKIVARY